jgi:sn-1 stearoyl-lipid 9-desaturase
MSNIVGAKPQPNWLVIIVITSFHLLSLGVFFTVSWQNFLLFFVLYFITGCLGITLGYHRLLTHKSFRVPKWLEYFFAICGCLALQGDPIAWVADHRNHHKFSDQTQDTHNSRLGFWHSHCGWLFVKTEIPFDFAKDLMQDKFYQFLRTWHFMPTVILGAILGVTMGWGGLFWGIFARTVWVYHVTWSVNSLSHLFGTQPFKEKSTDQSRNNFLVGWLAFGEGWHNNHHAYPKSPKHGILPMQFDLTWNVIVILKKLRLAYKLEPVPKC